MHSISDNTIYEPKKRKGMNHFIKDASINTISNVLNQQEIAHKKEKMRSTDFPFVTTISKNFPSSLNWGGSLVKSYIA